MTSRSKLSRFEVSSGRKSVSNGRKKTVTQSSIRDQIRHSMQQCRQLTLSLFDGVDHATFCCYAHPDFSPIGWHLGHIAYTEGLWILEHCAGSAAQFPHYRRLFAADTLPKCDRVNLPPLVEVQEYLSAIRVQVFNYLETAPLNQQERLWRWLLQHESQHCETIAMVLAVREAKERREARGTRQKDTGTRGHGDTEAEGKRQKDENSSFILHPSSFTPTPSVPSSDMVHIPAGWFEIGHESIVALDNEQPAQRVFLEGYWIDRAPVTCGQYRLFMQAGGYEDSRWWSAAGWRWLQENRVTQPLYWTNNSAWDDHPVYGVCWYEAEAYANFVSKRLPTEAEWEKAASWNPTTQQRQTYPWGEEPPSDDRCNYSHHIGYTTSVAAYSTGASPYGCLDMLGNVWEWTASWFDSYGGFEPYPYRGYSQAYFDGQHRVLRGGSWATRPWALRSAFRNWYYPHMREIFAGFRCVSEG